MKKIFFLVVLFFFSESLKAQNWTLRECIQTALENHPDIKLSDINESEAERNLKITRKNNLPVISSSIAQGGSLGRNIDPFTNGVITRGIFYNSIGLNASVPIYDAGRNKAEIKKNISGIAASKYESDLAKRELKKSVINVFFGVLAEQRRVLIAERAYQEIVKQEEVIISLIKEGIKPSSELLEIQLLKEQEHINYETALSNLEIVVFQLNSLIFNREFPIRRVMYEKRELNSKLLTGFDRTPEHKLLMEKKKMNVYELQQLKARIKPQVNLNFNTGTSYSSAAPEEFTLARQLNYNFGQYASLGVTIPVFNKNQLKDQQELRRLADLKIDQQFRKEKQLTDSYLHGISLEVEQNEKRLESYERQISSAHTVLKNQGEKFKEGLITLIELDAWRQRLYNLQAEYTLTEIRIWALLEETKLYE
jgi:outer membrane protein